MYVFEEETPVESTDPETETEEKAKPQPKKWAHRVQYASVEPFSFMSLLIVIFLSLLCS